MEDFPDFEARWRAEAMRLHEQASGLVRDDVAVRAARAAGGDPERRLCERARQLAPECGIDAGIAAVRSHLHHLQWLGAAVAAASGAGAALAVLGEGGRAVNVVWALGGLLGVNLFSLTLWCASLALGGGEADGLPGRIWLGLARRLHGRQIPRVVLQAWLSLLAPDRLLRWWLGAVSHGLWALALGAAVVGLLLAFSLRGYGFVWETTILSPQVFVSLVEWLGWLPWLLGFTVPDAEAIRAAGQGMQLEPEARRAWASWLIGCLVVYGALPRLFAWAGCLGRFRSGVRRVRLDPSLPGYARLLRRLAPDVERIGVTDPAPASLPRVRLDGVHPVGGGSALLVGFELRPTGPWPPTLPQTVIDGGIVDDRLERKRLLERLALDPPERLLLACDPHLTPDRGSLGFIAELSRHAAACRVWLVHNGSRALDGERLRYWKEALADLGLAPGEVFETGESALRWLEEGR